VFISYEENGNEHFAIVRLLTVTAAMARAWAGVARSQGASKPTYQATNLAPKNIQMSAPSAR
jgi:hypothetical protein